MEDEQALVAAALQLKKDKFTQLITNGTVQRVSSFIHPYYRFKHREMGVDKGTVVFVDKEMKCHVFSGYPKISRVLTLDSGLRHNFKGAFVAEEKMDGYNVRVARVDGQIVAITRGGILCPYTTYRLRKILGGNAFFDDNETLMLCGETVGLQNPYQEKSYPESKNFGYYVFDIRRKKDGKALPIGEKRVLLKKYALPAVPELGVFLPEESKKLLAAVADLGKKGREGIVLKSMDMSVVLKYTANESTNNDLKYAFKYWSDYGQAFFFRRIVREAFQCHEMCMDDKDVKAVAAKLGESIFLPLVRTIRDVAAGKEVAEEFDIVVPDKEFGEAFIEHLNHLGTNVALKSVREEKDGVLMRLARKYPSTNDRTKAYLGGTTWTD